MRLLPPALIAATLVALPLVGCKKPAGDPRGRPVVLALSSDPDHLNEYLDDAIPTADVLYRVMLHLMEEQPDYAAGPPVFKPQLASSWTYSADSLQITFHLRDDIYWSDGAKTSAYDVAFSHDAAIDPAVGWSGSDTKRFITAVVPVDSFTVRYSYSRAYPYQLMDANDGLVLPAHYWSKVPRDAWSADTTFDARPICNGSYRVEQWARGQQIILTRNERAPADLQPAIGRAVFRIIPDGVNRLNQLRSGEVDAVEGVPFKDVPTLKADDKLTIVSFPYFGTESIAWNNESPIFRDVRVRQAMALAIDRQQLIDAALSGFGIPAVAPMPKGIWTYDSSLVAERNRVDTVRAGQLLDQAGWRQGPDGGLRRKDGKPLEFMLTTSSTSTDRIQATEMMQQMLRRIGASAKPEPVELQTLRAKLRSGDFSAAVIGLRNATQPTLAPAFSAANIGAQNYSRYRGTDVARLDSLAASERNLARARPAFLDLQRRIMADEPMTFLYQRLRVNGYNHELQNVQMNSLSFCWNLNRWSWTE